MTINEEILVIANQIANKGNKPSVALIKAKLKNKVPLPVIISTLKTWQHEPEFIDLPEKEGTNVESTTSNPTDSSNAFERELHLELLNMKKEILELKAMIAELIGNQKQGN